MNQPNLSGGKSEESTSSSSRPKHQFALYMLSQFRFVREERTIFFLACGAEINILADCRHYLQAAPVQHSAISSAYACRRHKNAYADKKRKNSQYPPIGPRTIARHPLPELPFTTPFLSTPPPPRRKHPRFSDFLVLLRCMLLSNPKDSSGRIAEPLAPVAERGGHPRAHTIGATDSHQTIDQPGLQ